MTPTCPPFDAGDFDVFAPDMQIPKEISTMGQAVQALLTAYDLEVKEVEYGQANAQTPPIKAYTGDLIRDVKTARARLKGMIAAKEITPRRTNLTDRMKFESQAALGQLTGIFRNMWLNLWVNRRIDSANNTMRMLNDQLEPIMIEDEDFKQEIETIRVELDARVARAERVRDGLSGGLDNGMFEEMDDIPPPKKQPQQPQSRNSSRSSRNSNRSSRPRTQAGRPEPERSPFRRRVRGPAGRLLAALAQRSGSGPPAILARDGEVIACDPERSSAEGFVRAPSERASSPDYSRTS